MDTLSNIDGTERGWTLTPRESEVERVVPHLLPDIAAVPGVDRPVRPPGQIALPLRLGLFAPPEGIRSPHVWVAVHARSVLRDVLFLRGSGEQGLFRGSARLVGDLTRRHNLRWERAACLGVCQIEVEPAEVVPVQLSVTKG